MQLLAIILLAEICFAQDVVSVFKLSQALVYNLSTSAVTTLEFDLLIDANSKIKIDSGDYLEFKIPDDSTAVWDTLDVPKCTITTGARVLGCSIEDSKRAALLVSGQALFNRALHGTISQFKNPISTKNIESLSVTLFTNNGVAKVRSTSVYLRNFVASSIYVQLRSSSQKIGATEQTVKGQISPWTVFPAQGSIIFDVPDYFKGARTNFQINSPEPIPCTVTLLKQTAILKAQIDSCQFNKDEKAVTVKYHFKGVEDQRAAADLKVNFTISRFNNPITERKQGEGLGFGVQITDKQGYVISNSGKDLDIIGVSIPAIFKQYDFNYVDLANSKVIATHRFTLESTMPVAYGCRIRIVYPPDMKVGVELDTLRGTGFMEPDGDAVQFTANYTANSVDFIACRKYYGLKQVGSIILSKIRNQPFKHDLEGFKIYMTQQTDEAFQHIFQKVDTGFILKADRQKAGYMTGTVTPTSSMIQTPVNFQFVLKPSQDLKASSYMKVVFPESLLFLGPSCAVTQTVGFSQNIDCSLIGREAHIKNLFTATYLSKIQKPLQMTIESLQQPFAEQGLGTISVHIYDVVEGKFYEVEILEQSNLSSISGDITKTRDVQTSSLITSAPKTTYTFQFKIQHRVPVGSFFQIQLASDAVDGIQITDSELVRQNCFWIKGGKETKLDCYTGQVAVTKYPYVNINCTSSLFGKDGPEGGSQFEFKIGGLTNPRAVNFQNFMRVKTLDSALRPIDTNKDDQFSVTMRQVSQISSVQVSMQNTTNGVSTTYTVTIIPSKQIYSRDRFEIKFPSRIILPLQLRCWSPSSFVQSLSCSKKDANTIVFLLFRMARTHEAGKSIILNVDNVVNPNSLRPTASFTNMQFTESDRYDVISKFDNEIILATSKMAKIDGKQAGIIQSDYNPDQNSTVQLSFHTQNPLPSTAAIAVTVPPTMQTLYETWPKTSNKTCFMELNGVRQPYENSQGPICSIDANSSQIVFKNAFIAYKKSFSGTIKLVFYTRNPRENSYDLSRKAYLIVSYDDSSMKFGIDELRNTLYPRVDCEYPCNTCLPSNRKHCTTCLNQTSAPQFLHTRVGTDHQTCVDECPEQRGFTSNGTSNPQRCVKCSPTCATCAQKNKPGDVDVCLTCKTQFPYLWLNESKCFSGSCPTGTYESNDFRCMTCEKPCKTCSDKNKCTSCYALTRLKYLFEGQCLDECVKGYTPIDNICIKCRSPCATCMFGEIDACLSCDNTNGKQFLYGRSCLTQCPVNTTLNLGNKECKGCFRGCAACDEADNSVCLVCSRGLSLLNNTCREECPFNYLKSPDGTTCERRTYSLDKEFIFFPFLNTAFACFLVAVASYWLTGRRSLIISTLIALFGPIEMAAVIYQIYYSSRPDRNYKPILHGSIYCLVAGVVSNIIYQVNFHKQVKGQDRLFTRWSEKKWFVTNLYLALAAILSMTMHRLVYCRLFRLEIMSARVNRPKQFLRPFFIFTWVKMFIFNMPLIIVDFIGVQSLDWGNQCYMTMIESCTISFMSFLLLILEYCNQDSLIVREDQAPLSMDKIELLEDQQNLEQEAIDGGFSSIVPKDEQTTTSKILSAQNRAAISINQIKDMLTNNVTIQELKEAEQRVQPTPRTQKERLEALENCIQQVWRNKDLGLNGNFDEVLDAQHDHRQAIKRSQSMDELKVQNNPFDEFSENSKDDADSWPNVKYAIEDNLDGLGTIDEEGVLQRFHEFMQDQMKAEFDKNNKGDQYEDPVSDNLYASAREPEPEIEMTDEGIQTDQDKAGEIDQGANERKINQIRDAVTEMLMRKRDEMKADRKKFAKKKHRGKKSFYDNSISEKSESEESDTRAQKAVPTYYVGSKNDLYTNSMNIEAKHSLTGQYDLTKAQQEQFMEQMGTDKQLDELQMMLDRGQLSEEMLTILKKQGIIDPETGKLIDKSGLAEGDLDFSSHSDRTDEAPEDNAQFRARHPQAQELADKHKIERVQAWIKDTTHSFNQRNFNENEILGNFERDWTGGIKDRIQTLMERHFTDLDGNVVNQRGYLIDEHTGDIRSRYSYDIVFKEYELVSVGNDPKAKVELPIPLRIERYNFNPHECFGNFDYKKGEPQIILFDKSGHRKDKNFRRVNKKGWLIDDEDNVIDNTGRLKFMEPQLIDDDIPNLYNYEGREYNIKDIIGQFNKNKTTKEIEMNVDPKMNNMTCDLNNHKVNPKGYLLDNFGNIVNKKGEIIWRSHECMYNEPPKIFKFTQFSKLWISGYLDKDVTRNPAHDDKFDLNGHRINTMGYLINDKEDIVDVFNGNVVFKRDVLESRYGMEAEIPKLFQMGILREPDRDPVQKWLEMRLDRAQKKKKEGFHTGSNQKYGYLQDPGSFQDSDDDFDLHQGLKEIEERDRRFKNQGNLEDDYHQQIPGIPIAEPMGDFDRSKQEFGAADGEYPFYQQKQVRSNSAFRNAQHMGQQLDRNMSANNLNSGVGKPKVKRNNFQMQ